MGHNFFLSNLQEISTDICLETNSGKECSNSNMVTSQVMFMLALLTAKLNLVKIKFEDLKTSSMIVKVTRSY